MEATKVRQTTNYAVFRQLPGNRNTDLLRVNKLKTSIKENGQLQPIIVNEKNEIVDGQARFAALKELNMPINYIIAPGYGHKECVAMNASQTTWGALAYIKSYADLGVISYVYLLSLTREFKLPLNTILSGASDHVNARMGLLGIKKGEFKMNAEQYEKARDCLRFCDSFKPAIGKLRGRLEYYYMALIVIYREMPHVDKQRLFQSVNSHPELLRECVSIDGAMGYIEIAYNYHYSKKIYLQGEYRKLCDEHQKRKGKSK